MHGCGCPQGLLEGGAWLSACELGPLLSSTLCMCWGTPAKPLRGQGADPFPFKPVAYRTDIPSMWVMSCQMCSCQGCGSCWSSKPQASAGLNDCQSGPGVRWVPPGGASSALPHGWLAHPFIFSGRAPPPSSHLELPRHPLILMVIQLVSQETWSFKNSTEPGQARSRLSTGQNMHSLLPEPFPGIMLRITPRTATAGLLSPGSAPLTVPFSSLTHLHPTLLFCLPVRWVHACSWDISCSWNSCTRLGYPPAT